MLFRLCASVIYSGFTGGKLMGGSGNKKVDGSIPHSSSSSSPSARKGGGLFSWCQNRKKQAASSLSVLAAGNLCTICHGRVHCPVQVSCKHIFCDDCVSDWFDKERTCPLCRAVVKPAGLKSFADGHTSLFFQLF